MDVDILIRSYYKDLRWLRYSLESIERYAAGFRRIILVVPRSSLERLRHSGLDRKVETHMCEDFRDDYLGQQITKLYADSYSDADFICHVDSDCLFRRPTTPDDFFLGDKPVVPMARYAAFPDRQSWQNLTERFLCRPVEYEFMRRQPFLYPRWLYGAVRQYALQVHLQSLSDYVISQPPRGFSEYNALGAFAYFFYHGEFVWNERDTWLPDETICRWFWSWGGISRDEQDEIDSILANRQR